jgi:hypothetical protein
MSEVRTIPPNQALEMQDLATRQALRHSLNPPVSDFTKAAGGGVPPQDTLNDLLAWQAQGLVFSRIPNDTFATDGVQYRWRLTATGVIWCRDAGFIPPYPSPDPPPAGLPEAPEDGQLYGRENAGWGVVPAAAVMPIGGAHVHTVSATLNHLVNNSFLQFDTTDFDTAGFVVGSLPVDRLTIPAGKAGLYTISVQADTASSTNQANQAIVLLVNGTVGIAKTDNQVQGTLGSSLNMVGIWQFNVGDYIQAQYQDSAPNPAGQFNVVAPGTPSLALVLVG